MRINWYGILLLTGIASGFVSATLLGASCKIKRQTLAYTAFLNLLCVLVFSFMDIAPINFGHVLVIPKEHHTSTATIPEATAGRMFLVGARIGAAMRHGLDADGFNLHLSDGTVAGQVVMHAHLHVVPRWTDDGFHWNWRQLKYESDAHRLEIQEKIREKFRLQCDDAEKLLNEEEQESGTHHD